MTWVIVVSVGLGSYALRALPLFTGGRLFDGPNAERIIGYAGTAALSALIASGLRGAAETGGEAWITISVAAVALAVAARGGSMLRVLGLAALTFAVAGGLLSLLT